MARKKDLTTCSAGKHVVHLRAVCDLCPPVFQHTLNLDKLAVALKMRGVAFSSHSSQSGLSFEHGYAWVRVGRAYAEGRREGVGDRMTASERFDFAVDDPTAALAAWMAPILRTGRTCEVGKGVGLRALREVPRSQTCNFPWSSIVEMIEGRTMCGGKPLPPLDLNPDYQRDHVWTTTQQQRYLGHIFEGGAQAAIFVQQYRTDDNVPQGKDYLDMPDEVVDGKQRLTAIYEFMKGRVGAELSDGRVIWYKDFDEIDRRGLDVQISHVDLSRAERLRFYLKLNRGGTVHSEGEIEKVRQLLAKEEVV